MRGQAVPDKNNADNWATLKQLLPYLLQYKWRVLTALGFMLMAKLANLAMPFLIKDMVDQLSNEPSSLLNDSVSSPWVLAPIALVIIYGLFRFITVLFGEIRDTLFGRVTERVMRKVAHNVFVHLHRLDLSYHLNRNTGGLSRDIERGVSGISFLLRFMIFSILPTLIEIVLVLIILMGNYGFNFATTTAISIVAYIVFSVKTTNWRKKFLRAANKADSHSHTRAIDSLLNYETVKYYTNEQFEADRYDQVLRDLEKAKRSNRLSLLVLNGGQALIISVSMTAMMMLAIMGVQSGELTVGDFVLINAFMMQLFIPLGSLGFVYREIKTALINIEQMFIVMDIKPAIEDHKEAKDLEIKGGVVSFKQVDFQYDDDRKILDDINFSVAAGQTIAVVGASGSGKSTLVKLLFRFYDPKAGQVMIDGQDIKTVTQQSLRRLIGIVPQDTVLFNDSIMENIRYGHVEATDEQVHQAIDAANLRDFISQLPKGVETTVGERGLKLSGGEKQRVAIARTLLKNPPIMVFDEATSSLDSKSEQKIVTAIQEITLKTTNIVIAHRLSTIVHADKIIVMDAGKIVEQGNHETLLSKQAHYAGLWKTQQKSVMKS